MNGTDEQRDSSFVPDYICGDLDSVDEVIKLEYESKGSKSIRLYDQDATDFQKTLKFLAELCQVPPSIVFSLDKSPPPRSSSSSTSTTNKFSQIENIFVFCEFGGRIDHSLAIFSSLYDPCLTPTSSSSSSSSSSSKEEKRSCLNVYTVSSESITFLLRVGTNIIYLDSAKGSQGAKSDEAGLVGKYCGLFPMGRPAVVTTRGLKWNLNRQLLEFGKFISSSNEFCVEENKSGRIGIDDVFRDLNYDKKRRHVLIKTDQPLIWTMSINF
jgi:thiamine pyrophosphokinase